MVLEILMSVWILHKLILPDSVAPSCCDALYLITFNCGMDKGLRYAVLGDIGPDFEYLLAVCFVVDSQLIVPVREKKIIRNNNIVFLTPML